MSAQLLNCQRTDVSDLRHYFWLCSCDLCSDRAHVTVPTGFWPRVTADATGTLVPISGSAGAATQRFDPTSPTARPTFGFHLPAPSPSTLRHDQYATAAAPEHYVFTQEDQDNAASINVAPTFQKKTQ